MPIINNTSKKSHGNAIVTDNVKSYAADPYFIKKAEDAKEVLKKAGLPDIKKK